MVRAVQDNGKSSSNQPTTNHFDSEHVSNIKKSINDSGKSGDFFFFGWF